MSLILLDSSGNIKLDASGNIRVGADSDPCCCVPVCGDFAGCCMSQIHQGAWTITLQLSPPGPATTTFTSAGSETPSCLGSWAISGGPGCIIIPGSGRTLTLIVGDIGFIIFPVDCCGNLTCGTGPFTTWTASGGGAYYANDCPDVVVVDLGTPTSLSFSDISIFHNNGRCRNAAGGCQNGSPTCGGADDGDCEAGI